MKTRRLVISFVILCYGLILVDCNHPTQQTETSQEEIKHIIKVGMSLDEAIKIFNANGAKEVLMAMRPPEPPKILKNFKVSKEWNWVITIVADKQENIMKVVYIGLCRNSHLAMAERVDDDVKEIDLSENK